VNITKDLPSMCAEFKRNTIRIDAYLRAAGSGFQNEAKRTESYLEVLRSIPAEDDVGKEIERVEPHTRIFSAHFSDMSLRMAFIYLVAHFDAFLADVLEAVLVSDPNCLKSKKKQLTYEEILAYTTIEEIKTFIAKREVHEFGYKSIKDQATYFKDRFNILLEDSGISIEMLSEIVAARNLLVHSNGVVNHIYLNIVPNSPYKQGDTFAIILTYWDATAGCLRKVADHITDELTDKVGDKVTDHITQQLIDKYDTL
jgi:hypothetical protein